jgi:hypothetical protein
VELAQLREAVKQHNAVTLTALADQGVNPLSDGSQSEPGAESRN